MEGTMIHAMLSDRTARERYLRETPWADERQDFEVCEARRILAVAEAEPGDGRRVPAFRVEWGAAPTWARADASLDAGAPYFLALAEALASFVGAADPAAYLAAVSQ